MKSTVNTMKNANKTTTPTAEKSTLKVTTENIKANEKVPPIIVESLDANKFQSNNNDLKGRFCININRISGKKVIKCDDINVHTRIVDYMKTKNISAHSYQNAADRNVVLICIGIHYSVPEEIILNELNKKIRRRYYKCA